MRIIAASHLVKLTGVGSAAVVVLLVVLAVTTYSVVFGHNPEAQVLENRLLPGSTDHLLGTDQLGRDLLSRVSAGVLNSLATATILFVVAGAGGGLIGILSGYLGGKADTLLQRAVDAVMSMPLFVLVLAVVAGTGGSFWGVAAAMSVAFMPLTVRVARSSVLSLRSAEFVLVARTSGASTRHIVTRHIVPNIAGPWAIVAAGQVSAAILVESALAFLGAAPGRLTLGGLLGGDAQTYMSVAPWLLIWPGVTLGLLTLAINLSGEWIAERLTRLPVS